MKEVYSMVKELVELKGCMETDRQCFIQRKNICKCCKWEKQKKPWNTLHNTCFQIGGKTSNEIFEKIS